MKKVVVIYDCPIESCDKLWVVEQLKQKTDCEVISLDMPVRISHLEASGAMGKIKARFYCLQLAQKAYKITDENDVIFCWNHWNGLFMNLISKSGRRKIISYNWLTPTPSKMTKWIYRKALENDKLMAVINSEENRVNLLKAYDANDKKNIYYIPDVFDDSIAFSEPGYLEKKEERFCFMGGRANRDWDTYFEIARKSPTCQFRGIAGSQDLNDRIKEQVPENVTMYYDTEADTYYRMMQEAYIILLPVKENRVSALINIVKAIQFGKLVLTSDIPVIQMYYAKQDKDLLMPIKDADAYAEQIALIMQMQKDEYATKVRSMQKHLQEHFSPESAGTKISEMVNKAMENKHDEGYLHEDVR